MKDRELTDIEMDKIAELAASKAFDKFHQAVGRSVIKKKRLASGSGCGSGFSFSARGYTEMSYQFGKNSLENREGINPELIEILDRAVEISRYDFGIPNSGGIRTTEEQAALFTAGVSMADGRTHKSHHQTGNAVDVYAYVDGKASWDHEHLSVVAAAMLQASSELGIPLQWGGLWRGFCDRPHFQLLKEE